MVTPSSLAIAYLDPTALIPNVFEEEPVDAVTWERLNRSICRLCSCLLTGFNQFYEAFHVHQPALLSGQVRAEQRTRNH